MAHCIRTRWGEFTPSHIESLLKDLRRLESVRNLQVDLEDWSIISDVFSWIIKKRREVPMIGQDRAEDVLIDGSDKIRDVLKDIQTETDPDKKGP